MTVNKPVMNSHGDRHHQLAFPYDGFSGIQQRIVVTACFSCVPVMEVKYKSGSCAKQNQPVISVGYFSVFCCIRITVFGDGFNNHFGFPIESVEIVVVRKTSGEELAVLFLS